MCLTGVLVGFGPRGACEICVCSFKQPEIKNCFLQCVRTEDLIRNLKIKILSGVSFSNESTTLQGKSVLICMYWQKCHKNLKFHLSLCKLIKKKAWYRNLSIHSMILVQVRHLYIHWTSGDPPQLGALREMLIINFSFLIFHFQCRTFAPRKTINKAQLSKSLGMLQGAASHQVPRSGILSVSSPKISLMNPMWKPLQNLT